MERDPRFDGRLRPGADPALTEALLPVLHSGDSHAATLAQAANGDLVCSWFNGPGEGEPGTNIVVSRLPKGAEAWSDPDLVAADPDRSEQNPVLFTAPDGVIWLLHTSNEPHDQKSAHVLARTSDDHGMTWSEPRILFPGPGFFLRNPPLIFDDGSWLLPSYLCTPAGEHSLVAISSDGGGTWSEHELPESLGRVQPSVVERSDGSLSALFRSRAADRIYASVSADRGLTWSVPERTDLPNNNSAVHQLRLADGRLLLIFNDASLERDQFRWVGDPENPRKKAVRTPLTLALSEDDGATWPYRRNLQVADLEYRDAPMGYSYPTLLQTSDGRVHAAYSYLRKAIKQVSFDADWVCG